MHTIWLGLDFATSVTSLRLSVKMSTGFAFSKPINELFPDIFDERLRFKPGFEQVISTSVKLWSRLADWLAALTYIVMLILMFLSFTEAWNSHPYLQHGKKVTFPYRNKSQFPTWTYYYCRSSRRNTRSTRFMMIWPRETFTRLSKRQLTEWANAQKW